MSNRKFLRVWLAGMGILWAPAGPVLAQAPTPSPEWTAPKPKAGGTIVIGATARRRVPNTVADVVVGIEADGRDIATVSQLLERPSQALLEFLRQQGADRLRTEDVSVEPQSETQPNGRDRVVGYRGHLSISFRTTPQQLSALLGGSLEHGANTIIETVLRPSESEIDAASQELAVNATKTALAQAEAVAKAADARIVGIQEINVAPEGEVVPLRRVQAGKSFAASAAVDRSIATAPGEQELAVRVVVHATIDR